MTFKKKYRGYNPAEVDSYIADLEKTAERELEIRVAQKERIDELTEENYAFREQLRKYKENEDAIAQSLIVSQNLAQKMKYDADKYADVVLTRAKIFYATWRAYSQTIISSLLPEEVEEFNKLQRKIEDVINAYEGKDIAKEIEEGAYDVDKAPKAKSQPKESSSSRTSAYKNPITAIEQAAEQVIDLSELTRTDLSLEDLCEELGLLATKE